MTLLPVIGLAVVNIMKLNIINIMELFHAQDYQEIKVEIVVIDHC